MSNHPPCTVYVKAQLYKVQSEAEIHIQRTRQQRDNESRQSLNLWLISASI